MLARNFNQAIEFMEDDLVIELSDRFCGVCNESCHDCPARGWVDEMQVIVLNEAITEIQKLLAENFSD